MSNILLHSRPKSIHCYIIRQFNKDNCTNNYMSNNDSSQTQTNDLECHVSHDIQDHLCVGKGFFI